MSKSDSPKPASLDLSIQDIETISALVAERLNQNTLSQFLDERAAAIFVGLTHRSLQTMRYDGTGPDFVKLGDSRRAPIRYCRSDLIEWMKTRSRYSSTAKTPQA